MSINTYYAQEQTIAVLTEQRDRLREDKRELLAALVKANSQLHIARDWMEEMGSFDDAQVLAETNAEIVKIEAALAKHGEGK